MKQPFRPTSLLQPGETFAGKYRVVSFLSQGGFGAIFIGEHVETEERVAIKVLFPQLLDNKGVIDKFKLEARVAARVRSENIVKVLDAGFDDPHGMPYLVMELLEGSTLEKIVETRGPLPPALAIAYLAQVASGLDKAHGFADKDGRPTPIVHRDLKPENIFVTMRESGEPLVKILDFGIAKVLSSGTKLTQDVKGTPLFMSPEQAAAKQVSPQTDIWALGLIAFWLLTGKHYWASAEAEDATVASLVAEIVAMPMPPPSQRLGELGQPSRLGPAFDAWFQACVNRDAAARPLSAGEAIADLAEALGVEAPRSLTRHSRKALMMTSSDEDATEVFSGKAVQARSAPQAMGISTTPAPGSQAAQSSPQQGIGTTASALSATTRYSGSRPASKAPLYVGLGVGALFLVGASAYVGAKAVAPATDTNNAHTTAPTPQASAQPPTAEPPAASAPSASAPPAVTPVGAPASSAVDRPSQPPRKGPGPRPNAPAAAGKTPGDPYDQR